MRSIVAFLVQADMAVAIGGCSAGVPLDRIDDGRIKTGLAESVPRK